MTTLLSQSAGELGTHGAKNRKKRTERHVGTEGRGWTGSMGGRSAAVTTALRVLLLREGRANIRQRRFSTGAFVSWWSLARRN